MTISPRSFLILSASVAVGVVLADAWMPRVFRSIPTDMARSEILLDALAASPKPPSVCVFGNSVIMSGIDTRRLSQSLAGQPEVWNLSSSGQSLLESFLYYQELPDSVRVVVQCVFASAFDDKLDVRADKYCAFYMYGYRPSSETLRIVERCASDEAFRDITQPEAVQRFRSRWVVRAVVDSGLRRLLRSDLALARATTDLYFPCIGHKRISPAAAQHTIRSELASREPGFHPNENLLPFLLEMQSACRAKGRRFVLVIVPWRTEFSEHYGEPFLRGLEDYCAQLRREHGLEVVNAIDLFDGANEVFVDEAHLDGTGAERFTAHLAKELERLDICSSIRRSSSSSR